MSTLMIEQLENNDIILKGIKFKKDLTITNIRLGIYKKGNPDGDLILKIKDSLGNVLTQGTLTQLDRSEIPGTYYHGYVEISLDNPLSLTLKQRELELFLEVSLENHTNDEDNYLALIRNPKPYVPSYGDFIPSSIVAEDLWLNPFSVEVFSY